MCDSSQGGGSAIGHDSSFDHPAWSGELPSGTVTLLFTDIEGSTALVYELGDEYGAMLTAHRRVLRGAVKEAGGFEVDCRADEFFAVFQRAQDAAMAAIAGQRGLAERSWPQGAVVRVRMGLHTGAPTADEGAYVGLDVHRAARICSAAHGGQILICGATRHLLPPDASVTDLGAYSLRGLPDSEQLFQLTVAGQATRFPPPRADAGRERRRPHRGLSWPVSRTPTPPSLAETALRVRALLPEVEEQLHRPLVVLAAALLKADRAAREADDFLDRVDRRRLEQRLAHQRKRRHLSQRAIDEARRLERSLAAVEQLLGRRQALRLLSTESWIEHLPLPSVEATDALRQRVQTATLELDEAKTLAAGALDPLSFKLKRTRRRGIYRSQQHLYVVPFEDETGCERRREFRTLVHARKFRDALRLAAKAKTEYAGPSFHGSDSGGSVT